MRQVGTYADLDHVESCPEADPPLCAVMDIPDHLHDQDLWWFHADPTVAVGLATRNTLAGIVAGGAALALGTWLY